MLYHYLFSSAVVKLNTFETKVDVLFEIFYVTSVYEALVSSFLWNTLCFYRKCYKTISNKTVLFDILTGQNIKMIILINNLICCLNCCKMLNYLLMCNINVYRNFTITNSSLMLRYYKRVSIWVNRIICSVIKKPCCQPLL